MRKLFHYPNLLVFINRSLSCRKMNHLPSLNRKAKGKKILEWKDTYFSKSITPPPPNLGKFPRNYCAAPYYMYSTSLLGWYFLHWAVSPSLSLSLSSPPIVMSKMFYLCFVCPNNCKPVIKMMERKLANGKWVFSSVLFRHGIFMPPVREFFFSSMFCELLRNVHLFQHSPYLSEHCLLLIWDWIKFPLAF